jgi:hypothetical protein
MNDERKTSERAAQNSKIYRATEDELRVLGEADRSEIATAQEVAAAFKTFREKS